GLRFGQSLPDFVTEMKSEPKNTPETPSIANSACARGDCPAPSASLMSSVPCVKTGRPGRNFKVAGLGVASVSMNMEFSQTSGSKPELDRGTGIILKYDGDTANVQAVSLGREFFYGWRPVRNGFRSHGIESCSKPGDFT